MYRLKVLKYSLREGTDVDDQGRAFPDGSMIVVGTVVAESNSGDGKVVSAAELESIAAPDGHAILALGVEEPVLLVRLGEATGWVEHREEEWEGWTITDVADFEGRFFGLTTSMEVVEIEIAHPGKASLFLKLSDYFTLEERGEGPLFHVVDIDCDDRATIMFMTTKGGDILEVKEW